MFATWMTGPSAVGSENGIPSSMRFAPASSIAYTSCSVTSKDGSPQVINGINAFLFPPSKALLILLMNILPSVSCDRRTVLISSSGNIDYDDLAHRRCEFHRICDRMRTLDRRDDPFDPGKVLERIDCLIIGDRHIPVRSDRTHPGRNTTSYRGKCRDGRLRSLPLSLPCSRRVLLPRSR